MIGDHLKLPVCDIGECDVYGPGVEGPIKTGEQTSFIVDCGATTPWAPSIVVTAPNESSLEFQHTKEEVGVYKYTYVPKEEGEYEVAVQCGLKHVPGSPFSLSASSVGITPNDTTPRVNEEACINIDLGNAEGQFSLRIEGEEECEITSHQNEDGTIGFSFTPSKVGKYEISASLDGKPIWKIPLKLAVIDIKKVKVYGSGVTGEGASVGRPARVIADISEAGPAKVRASIKRPSGSKRSVSMKPRDKKNPHIVSGHYTPRTPGDHLLNVTFHKEPLPQSPFTVPIGCKNEPVTFGPGLSKATANRPNVLDVFKANIKPEEVSATFATCEGETLAVPLEVERISNDHCALKYFPQSEMVGCMEADVCYAGAPIGSHLSLPVTDPAECIVSGPGAEGPVKTGEETYLNVDCAEAGPCVPTVRVTGPGGDTVDSVRTSEEPGRYKFSYTPRQDGEYCVAVCGDGTGVPGSPFSVSSSPVGVSPCTTTPNVKEPLELNVDLSDAEGDFDLTVTGPEKCPVRSRDNPDGTKTFSFKPTKVGIYEITATLNRKPVWKKPLKIAVIDIDKVKVYGSGVTGEGASVGRPARVIADISEAGPAKVRASIKRPSGSKRSVSMKPRDKKNPHIVSGTLHTQNSR